MGLKKWDQNKPATLQMRNIILSFIGVLVFKILMYLLLKKVTNYLSKFIARFKRTSEAGKSKMDQQQEDQHEMKSQHMSSADGNSENEYDPQELERMIAIMNKTKMKGDLLRRITKDHRQEMAKSRSRHPRRGDTPISSILLGKKA